MIEGPDQPASSTVAEPLSRELARRLLAYREADRKGLATALHDEAAQTLANVALHLQICERAIAVDAERGRAELASARAALSDAIGRLRRQVFALRPTILEEAGLIATLKRHAALQPTAEGQSVEVAESSSLPRLDPEVELGLYRIAQAAIDAALARGGPRRVVVELTQTGGTVRLTVQDHGKPGSAPEGGDTSAPDTMRDWAVALDADLAIDASPELTTVTVSAPA